MSTKNSDDGKVSLEAALDQTGFGVYSYNLLAMTGVLIISFAMVAFSITIIIPTSACELETTNAQQGIIAATPVVGLILGAGPWGFLGDTRGRRNTLILSLLVTALVNIIACFSVNWIMLFIMIFWATFMSSGQYSLAMTLVGESVPVGKRNIVLLMVASIYLLTQGLMAVIAIPVIPLSFSYHIPGLNIYWNSWRTLLLIYTIPSILTALWMYFMIESPKFALAKRSEEEALEILRTIHRRNNVKEEFQIKGLLMERESSKKATVKEQIVPLFKAPLLKYTIIISVLLLLQQVSAIQLWFPNIVNQFMKMMEDGAPMNQTLCSVLDSSHDSPIDPDADPCALNNTAMLIVLATAALQSVANGAVSIGVQWLGRRNMVIVVSAFCGLCGVAVNLIPNTIASTSFFVIFLLGIAVVGLYTAISVALFPTHLRALALAVTMSGSRLGKVASVQVLNYLLINNCDLGFYIFSALFASSAIVALFLPDDRKLNKPQEEDKNVDDNTSL